MPKTINSIKVIKKMSLKSEMFRYYGFYYKFYNNAPTYLTLTEIIFYKNYLLFTLYI